ncbi:UNVERIFIED_CONTAM: putative membrane protein [Acetivibrio alkalicellulosi]
MTKESFLEIISYQISSLPEEDRNEILYDYEEHFRIGIESGKTEEEIAKSLGDPKLLAKQYKAHQSIKVAENSTNAINIIKAIFAIGALGLFNLVFALGPFIAAVSILFSFYMISLSLTLSGILASIAIIISPFVNYITVGINSFSAMCFSVFLTSFGILFFILTQYLTNKFFKYTLRYLNWNIRFIKN